MASARTRWLRLAAGIALSGGALWLALRRTSVGEIADVLAGVRWLWIPAVVALKVAVLVVKDVRWRVELRAMAPGPYRKTFRALGLGYFGNLLLPFKLGELLRVGLLKRHNPGVAPGAALATVAAERAVDGAVLAVLVGGVLPSADVPPWVLRGCLILLAVLLGVLIIGALEPVHEGLRALLPERGAFGWMRRAVGAASRGTAILRRPGPLAGVALLTALCWLGEAGAFYCAASALDLGLSFAHALIVTLLLSVGLLIPSAPGQIGTHQALAVLFLTPFGVAEGVAVSLSILLQAATLGTLGSIGGYVLLREAGARELVRDPDELGGERNGR